MGVTELRTNTRGAAPAHGAPARPVTEQGWHWSWDKANASQGTEKERASHWVLRCHTPSDLQGQPAPLGKTRMVTQLSGDNVGHQLCVWGQRGQGPQGRRPCEGWGTPTPCTQQEGPPTLCSPGGGTAGVPPARAASPATAPPVPPTAPPAPPTAKFRAATTAVVRPRPTVPKEPRAGANQGQRGTAAGRSRAIWHREAAAFSAINVYI